MRVWSSSKIAGDMKPEDILAVRWWRCEVERLMLTVGEVQVVEGVRS